MQDLEATYARAVEVAGSEYALARRLEVSPSLLYGRAKKHLSPELWTLIADVAGEDTTAALVSATIAANQSKPRGQWLRDALGKSLAAGVVVTTAIYAADADSAAAIALFYPVLTTDNLYIMSTLLAVWWWLSRDKKRVAEPRQPDAGHAAAL